MLQIKNISFSYEEEVLSNLNFNLEKGKTLAIIGESGCGKSTLLKLIYGLYDVDAGTIFWNDKQILGPKFNLIPGMEFMKYLAQDFDLMPYITVAENVGKYLSNIYKDKKQERISELLEIVEMTEFANTKAKNLSGGQMQRVALAKALALEPEVLLLDEPFSHIDNFRKNQLRRKLFSYLKQKNITTLFATHDSDDVLSFADEVIVLKDKKIIETGTPESIYTNTKNNYVASLFCDVNEIEIEGKLQIIYPHQLKITQKSAIEVEVVNNYFRGNYYLIEAVFKNKTIFFENDSRLQISSKVCLKKIDF